MPCPYFYSGWLIHPQTSLEGATHRKKCVGATRSSAPLRAVSLSNCRVAPTSGCSGRPSRSCPQDPGEDFQPSIFPWRSEDLRYKDKSLGRGNPAPTELLIGLFIILVAEILYFRVLFQIVKPLSIKIILFSAQQVYLKRIAMSLIKAIVNCRFRYQL